MSTNPDAIGDELDRTDELPRLDVAAYEATLANHEKALARTDIWSVSALHGMEELADANGHELSSSGIMKGPEGGALTVNVDAILKRIADLEADVVAAHEANEALQKRSGAIQADRDRLSARVQTLESENARQREHRELAQTMAERTERKQREDLQEANARIEELQTLLSAERRKAHAEQTALQERLTNLKGETSRLVDGQRALQGELAASQALSQERADAIVELEDALHDQKVLAAQLTRQLAAKLADFDKLSSVLDARNRVVDDLIATRDSLSERLQDEVELGIELTRKLSDMEQRCEMQRTQLDEQTIAIGQRDKQLTAATESISMLRKNLAASELRGEETQRELEVTRGARAEDEQRRLGLSAAFEEAEQTIASLRSEIEAGQARIGVLTDERNALLPLEAQLSERTEELERREQELVQVRELAINELDKAQAQILALSEQRDALLSLEGKMNDSSAELLEKTSELERVRAELEAAQSALTEGAQLAQQRASELDAMRSKLRDQGQTLRALEHTMATRDELAEQLRAQLQTLQGESAGVVSQLEKARRRVKVLTQEVFRRDHRIAELRTELTVHTEALAAIRRDVNRIGKDEEGAGHADELERVLEPVDHDGPSIVLSGKMLTVGRTTESDVCIPSKLVSRNHARLLVGPTGVIIEDAGSTNGCYVNGKQVRKHLMHDGDVLELGDLRYRLQTGATLADTKIRPNVIPMFEPRTQ